MSINTASGYYAVTSNLPTITGFTAMVWVKFNTVAAFQGTLTFGGTDYYYIGTHSSGVLELYNRSAGFNGSALSTGVWYHLCMTVSGTGAGGFLGYLNGALDITGDARSITGTEIRFGTDFDAEASDSVCMYGKAWDAVLTLAEIQADMRQALPVRTANIKIFRPFFSTSDLGDYSGVGGSGASSGTLTNSDGPPIPWRQGKTRIVYVPAGGGTTVTPGVGSLTVTGFAPTVSVTANQTVTPGVGVLTVTGLAPTIVIGTRVYPDVGALTLTGLAPTVSVSNHQIVTPGVGVLTVAGFAPAVLTGTTVSPGVGVLTLAGLAPTIAVTNHKTVTPGVGSLTVTGFAPTVTASNHQTVVPGVGALVVTGFAPVIVSNPKVVTPGVGLLTLLGFAPTVLVATAFTVDAAGLVLVPNDGSLSLVPNDGLLLLIPDGGTLSLTPDP